MANITTHLDATYAYTQAGLVGSLTYPVDPLNGNPTAPGPTTFTYSYDGMSRPVSVQDNRGPYQDPLAWAQGGAVRFRGSDFDMAAVFSGMVSEYSDDVHERDGKL